jgi:EpsG family
VIPYYIYFFLLWLPAVYEFAFRRTDFYFFSLIVFYFFLALRYETGYDWPAYKGLFEYVPGLLGWGDILKVSTLFSMEPFFIFFVSILRGVTEEFQILIITVSLIEVYGLNRFLALFNLKSSFAVAVIGTWLIFTLYFSVIRQGLAVSFFLLFYVNKACCNKYKSTLFFLLSLGFHLSSILYYVIFFMSRTHLKRKTFTLLFIGSLILSFFSEKISYYLFDMISSMNIPIVSEKSDWYAHGRDFKVNAFDVFYVYSYGIIMGLFLYKVWHLFENTLYRPLLFFSAALIFVQFLFLDYPVMRNRIQYVSFLMQFILIIRFFSAKKIQTRMPVFACIFVVFFTYYSLFLTKSSSLPFVPYQDFISYRVLDSKSDGIDRVTQAIYESRGN